MSLLDKAKENFEIAKYAAKKEYFDTAISRLYYSSYQRIIYYKDNNITDGKIKFEEYKLQNQHNSNTEFYGTHDWNIAFFKDYNKDCGQYGYESIMGYLRDMKELRNIADYKTRRCCINIDEYRKFENKGKLINNLIDILINVVKGEL